MEDSGLAGFCSSLWVGSLWAVNVWVAMLGGESYCGHFLNTSSTSALGPEGSFGIFLSLTLGEGRKVLPLGLRLVSLTWPAQLNNTGHHTLRTSSASHTRATVKERPWKVAFVAGYLITL